MIVYKTRYTCCVGNNDSKFSHAAGIVRVYRTALSTMPRSFVVGESIVKNLYLAAASTAVK